MLVVCIRMLLVCYSYVSRIYPYVPYVTRMLLECFPYVLVWCFSHDNMDQHCWAQLVSCVWPPCCDVLQHVGCCWLKFETDQNWANNTQHIASHRNPVANRKQHVAPNNAVLICCVSMLRSFSRGLTLL